jgi:hypothetical protein
MFPIRLDTITCFAVIVAIEQHIPCCLKNLSICILPLEVTQSSYFMKLCMMIHILNNTNLLSSFCAKWEIKSY